MEGDQIISGSDRWSDWLASPAGRYLLDWEQSQFDTAVVDVFGYVALQCGMPQLDCLRTNRMPSKISALATDDLPPQASAGQSSSSSVRLASFDELPFDSQSLDLVVLPHVLEFAWDPHQALREVERVLRPEGRLLVTGFNPVSLWGMRQFLSRGPVPRFVPRQGQPIGLPRLRDWLKLLGFELERGRYGCYRPPCATQKWLDRTEFMERAGDRWWPICGAAYMMSAVKRVRGMRLVGKVWRRPSLRRATVGAAAARKEPAANVHRDAIPGAGHVKPARGRG